MKPIEVKVNLNKVEDIKNFVATANEYSVYSDIVVKNHQRKFVVDANSIMGIFSLDLSNPVIVCIENDEIADSFIEKIKEFIVED